MHMDSSRAGWKTASSIALNMDVNGSFSIIWLSSRADRSQKSASLGKLLAILASLPSSVSGASTTVSISSGVKSQRESALFESESAGSAAAASAAVASPVIAPAASVGRLARGITKAKLFWFREIRGMN